jgi:hypothetical protein
LSGRDPFPEKPDQGGYNALGATAISRCKPGSPNAQLANFLGESLQDLPSIAGAAILRDKAKRYRSYGNEYLNVQFGWVPFLADIRRMVTSLQNATKIIKQYDRDVGRPVRRTYAFDIPVDTSSSDLYGYSGPLVGLGTYFMDSEARAAIRRDIRIDKSVWFAGRFVYHLPVSASALGRLGEYENRANILLGSRITPETLWELTPWSWFLDWFANLSEIVSNGNAASENLVIQYGYLMVHTKETHSWSTLPGLRTAGYGDPVPVCRADFTRETKTRVRATPFGFGLDWDGFNPFQLSILAALGIARVRR